jgi:uncharacterized glyoxalase superfamily protein PhnB
MTTVSPALRYHDAHAAIDFLERALGARRGMVHEGAGGSVEHAEVWFGDGVVMLGSVPAPGSDRMEWTPGVAATYVVIEDPDERHARAVEAGAEIVRELGDTDYGSRDFAVKDPEGNIWSFGTYRPQVPAAAAATGSGADERS